MKQKTITTNTAFLLNIWCTESSTIFNTMREFIEKVIAEKADKWVETFLYRAGGIIGTAVLIGLIGLVAQAYLYLNK